jgi:hypothetical protein
MWVGLGARASAGASHVVSIMGRGMGQKGNDEIAGGESSSHTSRPGHTKTRDRAPWNADLTDICLRIHTAVCEIRGHKARKIVRGSRTTLEGGGDEQLNRVS